MSATSPRFALLAPEIGANQLYYHSFIKSLLRRKWPPSAASLALNTAYYSRTTRFSNKVPRKAVCWEERVAVFRFARCSVREGVKTASGLATLRSTWGGRTLPAPPTECRCTDALCEQRTQDLGVKSADGESVPFSVLPLFDKEHNFLNWS